MQGAAFFHKFRSRRAVNRPIHSAASEQRTVGCVYNCIDHLSGNVALNDFDGGGRHGGYLLAG